VTLGAGKALGKKPGFTVVGVDLAGSPNRPTGVCVLRGNRAATSLRFSDEDIIQAVLEAGARLAAVDAPLSLPPGRRSIEDRGGGHFRPCDLELRERRIPFFPVTLGPMRGLTERGMRLKRELEKAGVRVVEIYPGGAQDVWGLPRARRDPDGLRRGLYRLGLRGLRRSACDHELDAASGALAGMLFILGGAEVLGDFETGAIIMPRSGVRGREPLERLLR
jgi:hypothetical protein